MVRKAVIIGIVAIAVATLGVTGSRKLLDHGRQLLDHATSKLPGVESATAAGNPAVVALDALPVKGRASMTGYSRNQFGSAWTDDNGDLDGHNGCDTRDDVLKRDLHVTATRKTSECTAAVESGTFNEPYTGAKDVTFTRGTGCNKPAYCSSNLQIDHVVPLGDAWVTGAQQLSATQRLDLANDPLELLAVDGPANEQKGDSDAASWLPANKSFRCRYVSIQVAVKTEYHLWLTSAEKAAIASVLATCPGQPLPTEPGGQG